MGIWYEPVQPSALAIFGLETGGWGLKIKDNGSGESAIQPMILKPSKLRSSLVQRFPSSVPTAQEIKIIFTCFY